jgi:DNA-binding MarR family transcriptional regulator/N-acetylglutamate synthase-like GNAT family acetyltransferase
MMDDFIQRGPIQPDIQRVRRFNRVITRRIGILTDDYLGRGRPWAESRLMFEIGPRGADVRQLRERLELDSGYLSRLLRSLEAQKLIKLRPSEADARVRRATLTAKGMGEWRLMETRSDAIAETLLQPLDADQRKRLLAAMTEVERILGAGSIAVEPTDPASDDAKACVEAYVQELGTRIKTGFDVTRGPSAVPADFVPPSGLFLLARLEGRAVGCIGLKVIESEVGEIKRMWVDPEVRGMSIARRLLAAVEEHAATMGLRTLRLDTNASQVEAARLYARSGFTEVPAYNDNPYADLWFEKQVVRKRGRKTATRVKP